MEASSRSLVTRPVHRSPARRWGVAIAAILTAAAAPLALAQELNQEVQALISQAKLGKGRAGVSLIDVDRGVVLAGVRASEAFAPASNAKLLTSGAALLTLGTDFTFRTEIIRDGARIIIRGSGDPALADPELLDAMKPKMTVEDVLTRIAGAVANQDVTVISELVVDDRVFDRNYVHPDWPVDQLNRWYCAEVAGVNFHTNVISVYPRPSPDGPGKPPLVDVQPRAPWIEIDNKARTSADSKNAVWLARNETAYQFTLFGEVRYPSRVPVYVTFHDAPTFVGRLMADRLADAGVARSPGFAVRLASPTEKLDGGQVVAVVKTPIDEVLRRCNKDSQNLYAEALFKRIGHEVTKEPGSWESGSAVVRMIVSERMGPDFASTTNLVDGSGLSKHNQVTPLAFTRWLEMMAKQKSVADAYTASMPTAGEGTLEERFKGAGLKNELRAKSGAINKVRCLSGYVIAPSGRRVAFSVLVNDLEGDTGRAAMKLHEDVVKLADKWLTKREPASQAKPAEKSNDEGKLGG